MPELQRFNDEFRDRLYLIGIDIGPFTGLGSTGGWRALLESEPFCYLNND